MPDLLFQNPDMVQWQAALAAVLISYLFAQVIAYAYVRTHQGISFSRSFVVSLVVAGLISAVLMLAIGNNLARGLGIVGTLALIRFRNQLHDPLDMMFIFASFASYRGGDGQLRHRRAGHRGVRSCGDGAASVGIRIATSARRSLAPAVATHDRGRRSVGRIVEEVLPQIRRGQLA